MDELDPENTGGAMLLGVNGVCVISHGSSSAWASATLKKSSSVALSITSMRASELAEGSVGLSDEQVAVVDYVVGRYGGSTGRELVRRTHLEDPWRDASEDEEAFATANPEIPIEALRAWFRADEEYVAHREAVTRLRERRGIYGFDGPVMPDDLREATLRMLAHQGSQLSAG